MEWQGVNLSDFREQLWLKQAIRNLSLFVAVMMIAVSVACWFWLKNQTLASDYRQQQHHIENITNKIHHIQQSIAKIKAEQAQPKPIYLPKSHIDQFIQWLNQLKVKGFIESIQLYYEQSPQIKLTGKFSNETDFDKLIQQLKSQYVYKVDYFQKNEQKQFEFSLVIQFNATEKQNEK
ncbi:MAG: hypothetical protein Q4A60_00860 [Pasteurellaceae bacterium]|nr:hypothetical protein [Pasteurellaceae bacterium]